MQKACQDGMLLQKRLFYSVFQHHMQQASAIKTVKK
jgi:hypothetical protein